MKRGWVDGNDRVPLAERGERAAEEMWRRRPERSGGGKWGIENGLLRGFASALFTHYWFQY